jgi:predicted nucleic acid-binding protein
LTPRPVVADSSFLLSFGKAGKLDLLAKTPEFQWRMTPIVRGELRTAPTRDAVEQLVLAGVISPIELDSDDEPALILLAEWSEVVDPGEAESIAVALASGWLVAIEDLNARRLLERRVGPGHWINCADVLVAAVQAGGLSLRDADEIFQSLDVFHAYSKRGISTLAHLSPRLKG